LFKKALESAGVCRETTCAAMAAMFAGFVERKWRYYVNGTKNKTP
jgi:hypothetical protein